MMTALTRLVLAGALGGLAAAGGATAAHADTAPLPTPLPSAQRTDATQAAASAAGLNLARRVAGTEAANSAAPANGARSARAAGKAEPATVVAGTTTEVYVLDRGFVTSGRGPAGHLGYVANTVNVDGSLVSVWSVPTQDGAGWQAVNAASGDLEARLARQAAGGRLLREPQVNAWYAVKGDRVLPLNADARRVVGAGMSTAAYQKAVHARYADKVAGSAYSRSGTAGGFGKPAEQAPAAAPAAPVAAPAAPAAAASAPTRAASDGSTGLALAGLGGAGLLAAGGAFVARRRARG